jgi:outer membrane cobalamin receptor
MQRSLLFLTIVLILSTAVAKTAVGDDTIPAGEVLVTATRREEKLLDVSHHVDVIAADEIEQSGAVNIAEVLDSRAGISISDYGPEGAQQSISLRGSTSEQVLVLVDGVRMNNAQSGGVDLSLLPLDAVERIEVVRGATSSLYGADAIGGVINIITRKEAAGSLRLSFENGSYLPGSHVTGFSLDKTENPADFADLLDTQQVTVQLSQPLDRSALNLSGSFTRAANGYIFKDTNNENRKRQNAELLGGNAAASMRVPAGTGTLGISSSFFKNSKGTPGSATSPTLDASQTDQRVQGILSWKTDDFRGSALSFDLTGHYTWSTLKYENPPSLSTHTMHSGGVDLAHELFMTSALSLIYGGNLSFDRLDSNVIGEKQRTYAGVFAELPLFLSARTTLQPALRYDYYSDFGGSLNYKLGLVHRLSETTSLKSSISKAFRAPTFNDLYWPTDPMAEGDPNLQPETSWEVDAGVTRITSGVSFDLFGFMRYSRDVILWQPGEDGVWRPSNWGEALYPGVEAAVDARLSDKLSGRVGYTYLHTYVLSGDFTIEDNKRLPMIPVHELDASLTFDDGTNLLSAGLHYESLRYERTSNEAFLPAHTLVDLLYRRQLSGSVSLYAAVDNLFNESYQSVDGYPMPRTFIRTGVDIDL